MGGGQNMKIKWYPTEGAGSKIYSSKELKEWCLNFIHKLTSLHDISHGSAPSPLRALFLKSNEVHRYNTRSTAKGNFFQKDAKLEIQKRSFSRFGTLVWNNIAPALGDKPKTVYRKTIRNSMFNLLSAEDDYVEINKIVDFLKSLA